MLEFCLNLISLSIHKVEFYMPMLAFGAFYIVSGSLVFKVVNLSLRIWDFSKQESETRVEN